MGKKKAAINKSQLIRDYAKSHRSAGPTEIAKTLTAKHKTTFSPPLVSKVLAQKTIKKKTVIKNKTTVKKKRRRTKSTRATDDLKAASSHLIQAVELVASAGAKEAKELVAMAEKMVERIRG